MTALDAQIHRRNRTFRWLVTILVFLFALPFLAYVYVLCRYWSSMPKPTRNFAAEINAPILAIAEEERAWPRYREALVALEKPPQCEPTDYHPDAPGWPHVVAYLDRNQQPLAMLREAATLPQLGYPLSDAAPAEDMVLAGSGRVEKPSENPMLISVLLMAAQGLDVSSRYLAADAYLAADRDDQQRAWDDLVAVCAMADHVRESPFAVSDQTSWRMFSRALGTAGDILHDCPDLWSDDQLASLAARIAAYSDGRLAVRTSGERMNFEDVVQRCYTDDGQGGGDFHAMAAAHFAGEEPGFEERFLGPLIVRRVADRRELMNKFNEIMDRCDAEFALPLWRRSDGTAVDEIVSLKADRRYFLLTCMFPALTLLYHSAEETTQRRDATLVAIALVRHRKATGSWPGTLSDLVPGMLEEIPADRCDGQPLRLRLEDGRPVLYSVGFDRDDDRGEDPDGIYRGSNTINRLTREVDFRELGSLDGDWILWPPTRDEPPPRRPPGASDLDLLKALQPGP
jgi:hypothetical protein